MTTNERIQAKDDWTYVKASLINIITQLENDILYGRLDIRRDIIETINEMDRREPSL